MNTRKCNVPKKIKAKKKKKENGNRMSRSSKGVLMIQAERIFLWKQKLGANMEKNVDSGHPFFSLMKKEASSLGVT